MGKPGENIPDQDMSADAYDELIEGLMEEAGYADMDMA